jgi:hypothetical protein
VLLISPLGYGIGLANAVSHQTPHQVRVAADEAIWKREIELPSVIPRQFKHGSPSSTKSFEETQTDD